MSATPSAHKPGCLCTLCQEYRELNGIVETARQRGWYINPAVMLRLNQIETEIGPAYGVQWGS